MILFKNDQATFAVENNKVVIRVVRDDGGDVATITISDDQPLKSLLITCMAALNYEVATLSENGRLIVKMANGRKGQA